jgi:hypothetical protein
MLRDQRGIYSRGRRPERITIGRRHVDCHRRRARWNCVRRRIASGRAVGPQEGCLGQPLHARPVLEPDTGEVCAHPHTAAGNPDHPPHDLDVVLLKLYRRLDSNQLLPEFGIARAERDEWRSTVSSDGGQSGRQIFQRRQLRVGVEELSVAELFDLARQMSDLGCGRAPWASVLMSARSISESTESSLTSRPDCMIWVSITSAA